MSPGHWEQQSALFGIVRMNSTYNGHRLGTALFKVCDWLGITHKISWVTCDNASNNNSIMMHFAAMIQWATGKEFNAVKWQIQWDSSSSCHMLSFGSLIYKGVLCTLSISRPRQWYQNTQSQNTMTLKSQMMTSWCPWLHITKIRLDSFKLLWSRYVIV